MKKYWKLLPVVLLGLVFAGITGCQKDEASSADATMKDAADHSASQVPKDHPAH